VWQLRRRGARQQQEAEATRAEQAALKRRLTAFERSATETGTDLTDTMPGTAADAVPDAGRRAAEAPQDVPGPRRATGPASWPRRVAASITARPAMWVGAVVVGAVAVVLAALVAVTAPHPHHPAAAPPSATRGGARPAVRRAGGRAHGALVRPLAARPAQSSGPAAGRPQPGQHPPRPGRTSPAPGRRPGPAGPSSPAAGPTAPDPAPSTSAPASSPPPAPTGSPSPSPTTGQPGTCVLVLGVRVCLPG
jgi:hypothetical protein